MKLVTITGITLLVICGVAAAVGTRTRAVSAAESMCAAEDFRVVVDLERHVLALCEKHRAVGTFDVRLGRGGLGKSREGDGKTPMGTYSLGSPRPSKRFGTFIPIGYPTNEQQKKGYTGSAVGIHGPRRWAKWLGSVVNTFDLSDGCVGVARDSEIEKIADWVRSTEARTVELH